MNAKRNSTVFIALSVLLGTIGSLPLGLSARADAPAAPASGSPQPGGDRELTRGDVDALLRQARTAIKEGNLDQADALLTRAENAGVHYPIFHFGSTPSSVRREFVQAARKNGGIRRPATGSQPGSRFALSGQSTEPGNEPGENKNPFQGRSMALPPTGSSNNPMPWPVAPSTQAAAQDAPDSPYNIETPLPRNSTNVGAGAARATTGPPVANPFAASPGGVQNAEIDSFDPDASLAESQSWQLPDAPLPPDLRGMSGGVAQPIGLAAPRQSAYQAATESDLNSPSGGTIQKQQVLDRMQSAREAMAAGDLDLAEKLTREASAAGVPESQFLPDEDRPSQLAWEIVHARQVARGVPPAGVASPAEGARYAQQAGQLPVGGAAGVVQAGGTEPSGDSSERWAMAPDPLSLPPEATPPMAAPSASAMPRRLTERTAQITTPATQYPPTNEAADLLDAGEAALRMHDRKSARELLNQAHLLRDQLAPTDRDRLQEHLHMLAAEPVDRQIPAATAPPVAIRQAQLPTAPRAVANAGRPTPDSYTATEAVTITDTTSADGGQFGVTETDSFDGSPFVSDNESQVTTSESDSLPQVTDSPLKPPLASRDDANQPEEFELPPSATVAPTNRPTANPSLIDSAAKNDQVLARQISAEVGKRQSEAQRLLEKDPDRAKAILVETQQMVKDSQLSSEYRRDLLSRIDITLAKTDKYIAEHLAEIELDRANEAVLDAVEHDRDMKTKLEQKKAELVEQFNQLEDEQRYAEMEIVARRLYELAPDDPLAQQVWNMAKFIRRERINRQIQDEKEIGNWNSWNDVERASIANVGDGNELTFGDKRYWDDFVKKRVGSRERTERRTQRELEIERRLKTPVMLKYQETPLSQVMDGLSAMTGINIHLDPRGLSQEGVNSDTPITVNLSKEVSLKSALNLILEPLHLSYVVKDEVLKITSEQLRDGEIYPKIYNVADLVIPIPNFVPNSNIGLQGLINDAHSAMGYGNNGFGGGPTVLVNDRSRTPNAAAPGKDIVAQQFAASPNGGAPPSTVPIGAGPGGMGGGANADFDSLIDLIVSTVSTETWAENGGGEAEIRPFPTNLSLVVSQTQAVHEEIADLLEQLRRLQDLQITIEVRFIRLNDRFFERIGVDFQMSLVDPQLIGGTPVTGGVAIANDGTHSATVGLLPPAFPNAAFPNFTADLDIPFRQGSFSAAVPTFGGFDAATAANFGFAILSDIEAFFLIEAAQGDVRSNVLNAPKVTLFNGQQAFVADTSQRPFVIGVIPVVGEFVAAQQPVIVVLNEGTMMTIQAVVSDDRRYIRLTVVPFFTQIGNVDTFTFEGASSSTSSSSSSETDDDNGQSASDDASESQSSSGVTVQLPTFSFVSVVTTVSVPDGGTVLLGGIKRLQEGRNEFGVPLLSKIPYVDRLFRNIGIGRTTESLMMMVTPRIIIQEEEEERLGIATP